MKYILLAAIYFLFNQSNVWSQIPNPNYDVTLAEKLGGDEYGMKNYILAILKTGPTKIEDKDKLSNLFRGHLDNIHKLVDEGLIIVAGPFGQNDLSFRGLFIFNVKTIEEAKVLCDSDPAIKAGIFEVELIPWYGSAALGEYLKTSEKINKFKI